MNEDRPQRKALYRIPEAMRLLSLSRSVIYELIRSGRLRTVKQGRTRLVPRRPSPNTSRYWNGRATERSRRMTKRRSRGDGGLHWDEARQRWIASVTVGYTPAGKRIVRKGSGKTKTEARNKLKRDDPRLRGWADHRPHRLHRRRRRDRLARLRPQRRDRRAPSTSTTALSRPHHPRPGCPEARELTAKDVDRWLADKAKILSTRTLRLLHSVPQPVGQPGHGPRQGQAQRRRPVHRARGPDGRPSKSLDLRSGQGPARAAEHGTLHAYIVLSLLTGARTEELRALTWDHVDLDGEPDADPPRPAVDRTSGAPYARAGTPRPGSPAARWPCPPAASRPCAGSDRADQGRDAAGDAGGHGLVFASAAGTAAGPANVRRAFRPVVEAGRPRPGRVDATRTAPQLRLAAVRPRGAASRRSPTWSATPAPRSPRRSTATSCARSC